MPQPQLSLHISLYISLLHHSEGLQSNRTRITNHHPHHHPLTPSDLHGPSRSPTDPILQVPGDKVQAVTIRKVTKEAAGLGGPDSERVKLKLCVVAEAVDYDAVAGELRVRGKNITENEHVKLGGAAQDRLDCADPISTPPSHLNLASTHILFSSSHLSSLFVACVLFSAPPPTKHSDCVHRPVSAPALLLSAVSAPQPTTRWT